MWCLTLSPLHFSALSLSPPTPTTTQHKSKKAKFVHDLIREVGGLSPYERRCVELLRVGKDKRALKYAKKRVSFEWIWSEKWIWP